MSSEQDEQIRDLLARRAASVSPQGTYADLDQRLQDRSGRRWTRTSAVLLGVAAVLALLLGAAAVAVTTGGGTNQQVRSADPGPQEVEPATTAAPSSTGTSEPVDTTAGSTTAPPTSAVPSTDVPTTSTPTTTTSSVPPSTEPPPPPPPPDELQLTTRGIGPVVAGMTLDEASAATGWSLTFDPNSSIAGTPGVGCGGAAGTPAGIWFTLNDTTIETISVSGDVTTSEGIGVGATADEVRAAYPGARQEPHAYGSVYPEWYYLVVDDPGDSRFQMYFHIEDGEKVASIESGLADWLPDIEGCA